MPVKLWVEAVGKPKPAPEEIWVIIHSVHKNGRMKGSVNTKTERYIHHGVKFDMPIEFYITDVIDTVIQGDIKVAKRQ